MSPWGVFWQQSYFPQPFFRQAKQIAFSLRIEGYSLITVTSCFSLGFNSSVYFNRGKHKYTVLSKQTSALYHAN